MGKRHDHLLRLRQINKDVWRDFTYHRMPPAHQHFNAANLQGIGLYHRLVDHVELVVFDPQLDRFPRIGFDRQDVVAEQAGKHAAYYAKQQGELGILAEPTVRKEIHF